MKTMVDNAKIARMEKDIKETDAKVKNIKSVPPSTTADAGKVLTVGDDGSLSWQQKGVGGGMKAFFDAGGKCGYSTIKSFDGIINFGDTAEVRNMNNLFIECREITSIPLLNTSKATSMNGMFSSCLNLASVPLFDTSKVKDMNFMFSNCTSLLIIPAFDVSNANKIDSMFTYCYSLEAIHLKNIGSSLKIYWCENLTREALLEIIGNLKTVTSTKTLEMGSKNLAKLTEEDKAIATNKGWTLA